MKMFRNLKSSSFIFLATLFFAGPIFSAEIHVITSGAFADALKVLAPEYEKQSSNKVIISYGSSMGPPMIRFHPGLPEMKNLMY